MENDDIEEGINEPNWVSQWLAQDLMKHVVITPWEEKMLISPTLRRHIQCNGHKVNKTIFDKDFSMEKLIKENRCKPF